MSKATTIKEALKKWEEKSGQIPAEATDIQLQFQWPPVEKMDSTLSALKNCEKLSLSTNMIEKITGLDGMKNLRILSLARNSIKSLSGIETLSDTLEELWISYNFIDKLKGIEGMNKLKVFYVANNLIKEWTEITKLSHLPMLEEVDIYGNPLVEHLEENAYRNEVIRRMPKLKKLDGEPIVRI